MHSLIWLALGVIIAIIARIYVTVINPRGSIPRIRGHTETCHLAVFLGSGGHSSEALSLVSALDFSRYTPRTYLVSEGDSLSAQKAVTLEQLKTAPAPSLHPVPVGGYQILTIPRARHVHQSILTVPFTALRSLLAAVYHVTLTPWRSGDSTFDVLLLNGPGTSSDCLLRDSFISRHLRASECSRTRGSYCVPLSIDSSCSGPICCRMVVASAMAGLFSNDIIVKSPS